MITRRQCLAGAAVPLITALSTKSAAAFKQVELVEILRAIDARQTNLGDWRGLAYMEQKARGKVDVVYEVMMFRRNADKRFMLLFTKPKASQGQGYLRVDKNLWFYSPTVGNWERRTQRERLGGTNSRRSDFDGSQLALDYDPKFVGEEKLGVFDTLVMRLDGKPDLDLAFPMIKLWVDKNTRNVLKRQEYALSGRLLRTSYYTKWTKIIDEAKKAEFWYAKEMRYFDELEKANSTFVVFKEVNLSRLEPNIFTKAWLESKSR
jgi:outer membrane lipoprotein-sorting protein